MTNLLLILLLLQSLILGNEHITILDFEPINISYEESRILSQRLISEMVNLDVYRVIEKQEMEKLIGYNSSKLTFLSECVNLKCAVDIGRMVGAKFVVIGTISLLGKTYSVDSRLINVETSESYSSASFSSKNSIDKLLNSGMKSIAEQLCNVEDKEIISKEKNKVNSNINVLDNSKSTDKIALANVILRGKIKEEVDFRGNRLLSGYVKNIGEARAHFVKINFTFRMNWKGETKSLLAYVRGSKHIFPDSNIESDSSIELGAVAEFELVIPADFGTFIGYSYSIDWEQYDD